VYVKGVGVGNGVSWTTTRSSGVSVGLRVAVRNGVRPTAAEVPGVRSGEQAVKRKKRELRSKKLKMRRGIARICDQNTLSSMS
jgi:hypothetical protein